MPVAGGRRCGWTGTQEIATSGVEVSCENLNGLRVRDAVSTRSTVVDTYGLQRLKRLDLLLLIRTLSEYVILAWNPGRPGGIITLKGRGQGLSRTSNESVVGGQVI